MAILSNINGKFAVDSSGGIQFSGQTGTSGYVLKSNGNAAPTWVDGSTVIGGPYLPLSGGTLTGATATASGISFTVGGALTVSGTINSGAITSTGLINGRGISSGQSGESNIANETGETWIGSNGLRYNTGAGTFARSSATAQAAMMVLTDTADVEFYAQPSTSQTGTYALSPKMVIKGATGNVGIGVTDPKNKLNIFSGTDTMMGFWGTSTYSAMQSVNLANTVLKDMRFDFDEAFFMGNAVGIGTTSPDAKFQVEGNVKVGSASGASWTDAKDDVGGLDVFVGSGSNAFSVWDDNAQTTPRFLVSRAGNVGVGGAAGVKFEVYSGSLRVRGSSANLIELSNINGNTRAALGNSGNEGDLSLYRSNNVKTVYLSSYYNSYINPDGGNLGIGTTGPFSKLQVGLATFTGANGMYANSRVGVSNHGILTGMMLASTYNDAAHPEYGLVFVQGPNTSSYNVWSISPDGPAKGSSLVFNYQAQATNIHSPANAKVVFQGSTGNVGINTTSPSTKLSINDANYVEMATFSAASGSTAGIIANNSGYVTGFTTSATHQSSNTALFVPVTDGIKITKAGLLQITTAQDFRSTTAVNYAQVDIYKNTTAMFYSLRTNSNSQWDMLNSSGTMIVAANDVIKFRYATQDFLSMDEGAWSQYSFIWTSR